MKSSGRNVRLKKKRVGRVWTIHWTTAVAMVRMYVLLFAWALLSVAYFVLVESATVLTSSDARAPPASYSGPANGNSVEEVDATSRGLLFPALNSMSRI